jgi:hypothetical protein
MPLSRITLVAHTHWDREWYEPFETFRAQLVEVLDEALDLLERDPRLVFTLDGQVALVDDYLAIRPEAEPRIRALVGAGRLHIGPFYTQPDSLLVDGEALLRNLALGLRRGDQLGGALRVGYLPDPFGHAAQLPQLFRRCGIDGAVLWRGVGPDRPPHAFRWAAPDGSEVTALWLQDGYASGRRLPSDPAGFADAVERALVRLQDWAGELPILVPIGDDHVRLPAWLPEAAAALAARRPDLRVAVGGYHDHLPAVGRPAHVVRGELRSPAFAPVLAGVASARAAEKRATAAATTRLLRSAEPLAAWVSVASHARRAPTATSRLERLLARAWREVILNHAHDSAAGCGSDAAHEDVRARARWAQQLADAVERQALSMLRVGDLRAAPESRVVVFAAADEAVALVEADVPRALGAPATLVSIGADGVARPLQALEGAAPPPVFEGELAASELMQYLGGLDPATPLFGRFLTGITATPDGPGRVRLDVGLGDAPVPAAELAAEQARVQPLLDEAERFRVVLHSGAHTQRVLVAAGPVAVTALAPVTIAPRSSEAPAARPGAQVEALGDRGLRLGDLAVTVADDGAILVGDAALGMGPVRVDPLVDEGDRGDLYHFDGVGAPIRAGAARARVVEAGPLRGRLRIEHTLAVPVGLTGDRRARAAETVALPATTEVTLQVGAARVDVTTSVENLARDHRLRALVRLPLYAERLDVEHGLAVVARPLDPAAHLGHGNERAAPTGQHHGFVDVSDGERGAAIVSPGLLEHEVLRDREAGATTLALTLLRAVGWLSRGDLSVIDHAVGPMIETPGAEELGTHRVAWSLILHRGTWQEGAVHVEARRATAPPRAVTPSGTQAIPAGRPLVSVAPAGGAVQLAAVYPSETSPGALVVRLVHLGSAPVEARLETALPIAAAAFIDPVERPLAGPAPVREGQRVARVTLAAHEVVTLLLRLAA